MNVRTLGRCPDCGEATPIVAVRGSPIEILKHGCRARPCATSGCLVSRPPEEMVQLASEGWYCPSHALLAAVRQLVALHRTAPNQALTAELLETTVPAILDHFPS